MEVDVPAEPVSSSGAQAEGTDSEKSMDRPDFDSRSLSYIRIAALADKLEDLKVAPAPPKQPEVVFEEPTVDEGEIMKAYNALMAEDPRWEGHPWWGVDLMTSQSG